jgi:uncharacterized integral membrane protein
MSRDRVAGSKLKLAFAGILLAIVLVLVVQNQEPVTTQMLFWTFFAPSFALLAIVFLVGIVVGYLLGRGPG